MRLTLADYSILGLGSVSLALFVLVLGTLGKEAFQVSFIHSYFHVSMGVGSIMALTLWFANQVKK